MDTKKLRQKILDLAIRGKLVPQDPDDEPASLLLERIHAEKERLIKEGKIKRSKKVDSDDEIEAPFEIPESWEWIRLEDFVMAVTDGDHLPPPQSATGVPFLVISDVNTGDINFSHARFVSEEYYKSLPTIRKATKGDILFTVTGSYGITILIDTEQEFCFQRHIGLIKTISSSEWITCFLQSAYTHKYCDKVATGTAQKTVSLGHLRDLVIPIPPLSEQKRIVYEVKRWFALIDELEGNEGDMLKTIDHAKSKILDLAIRGKLVPQDPNDEPAIKLLKRINPKYESCEKGNLPNSWCAVPVNTICRLTEGEVITDKDYPYLDVKGLRTGEFVTKQSGKFVCKGTKLILVDGENSGEVFLAPIEGYQGSTMKVLDIAQEINTQYVLYYIKLHQKALRENKVGSAIPHLNKKMFRELVIPIPPLNEQLHIAAKIEELFTVLDSIKESLA